MAVDKKKETRLVTTSDRLSARGRRTDEQVEDDVGDDDVEGAEEDEGGREVSAVRLPVVGARRAERRQDHAVVHDLVPVLAGDDAEQHDDAPRRAAEIGLPAATRPPCSVGSESWWQSMARSAQSGNSPAEALSVFDRPEQDAAGEGVDEDEQEHAHDDEEALVDGHDHRQHQHLQRGVLARDGEEAQDDHHEAERVRQVVLQTNVMSFSLHFPNGSLSLFSVP